MYSDEFPSPDLLCERASMLAHLATTLEAVTDAKSRAMLRAAMDIVVKSITPATASVVSLRPVSGVAGS